MATTIPDGEIETWADADQYLIRCTSGEVGFGPTPRAAKASVFTLKPATGWIPYTPSDLGNTMKVASIGGSADVEVQANEGFRIELFGTYNYGDRGPPSRTERIPAEGVVEVNADQSQTVSEGGSVTSTVTADTDEVWQLAKVFLEVSAASTAGGGAERHSFRMETEKQGVGLALGRTAESNSLKLEFGTWSSSGNLVDSEVDFDTVRIDDTNGIKVIYALEADGVSDAEQTNARTIRLAFERIRA